MKYFETLGMTKDELQTAVNKALVAGDVDKALALTERALKEKRK